MSPASKIYWGVGLVSTAVLLGAFLFPEDRPEKNQLPWHIEHPAPGTVAVFGLTLGVSTPADAEQRFSEQAIPSLFKSPSGDFSAEVFFEQVELAGLRSRVVLTVDLPPQEIQDMYQRGLRIASTGSGKKITLTADDTARVMRTPISSLTYLPGIHLNESLLIKRFGRPAQIVREKQSGVTHWLYPDNGLDISLSPEEKPLLQYVAPASFDKLVKPLRENGEIVSP